MDSESGSKHDTSELFSDSLDEDTRTWESPDEEEMEDSDSSFITLIDTSSPRKLVAYFPELKVNDNPGSFMELHHLCVMIEKLLDIGHWTSWRTFTTR